MVCGYCGKQTSGVTNGKYECWYRDEKYGKICKCCYMRKRKSGNIAGASDNRKRAEIMNRRLLKEANDICKRLNLTYECIGVKLTTECKKSKKWLNFRFRCWNCGKICNFKVKTVEDLQLKLKKLRYCNCIAFEYCISNGMTDDYGSQSIEIGKEIMHGTKQSDISRKFGCSRQWVSQLIMITRNKYEKRISELM